MNMKHILTYILLILAINTNGQNINKESINLRAYPYYTFNCDSVKSEYEGDINLYTPVVERRIILNTNDSSITIKGDTMFLIKQFMLYMYSQHKHYKGNIKKYNY